MWYCTAWPSDWGCVAPSVLLSCTMCWFDLMCIVIDDWTEINYSLLLLLLKNLFNKDFDSWVVTESLNKVFRNFFLSQNAEKTPKKRFLAKKTVLEKKEIFFFHFFNIFYVFLKKKSHFLKKLQFYTIVSTAKFYYRIRFFGNFP